MTELTVLGAAAQRGHVQHLGSGGEQTIDHGKEPQESFPFDQTEERYSMYALKAYGLPRMYRNGMLKGRM